MSYWHVGMEVVCIKDATQKVNDPRCGVGDLGFPLFRKGDKYTISGFDTHPELGLFLSFAECDPRHLGHESGFAPISKRKTSIEVFTRILRNPHVRIREDA